MARMTDTRAGYAALMGRPVYVQIVGTETDVTGLVWAPAPLSPITSTAKHLRKALGMAATAAGLETVWVHAEGGRLMRAEIDTSTGRGYGTVCQNAWHTPTHLLTDEEILAAYADAMIAEAVDSLFDIEAAA